MAVTKDEIAVKASVLRSRLEHFAERLAGSRLRPEMIAEFSKIVQAAKTLEGDAAKAAEEADPKSG